MKKGQGLVEFVIILPLLVFLFFGVLEVGWALRGYLVLINATREAGRFAARPGYLDNPASVYTHTLGSLSGQIDFQKHGKFLMQTVRVENYCTDVFTITYPLKWAYPITPETRVDYTELERELKQAEYRDSCNKLANSWVVYPHTVVIVEMWYDQPQLFGFPVLSNPILDPVPMYERATFRVGVKREDGLLIPTAEPTP